ncbi:MAG: hypothetical protein SFX73_06360 [Kofleriaceae bacterium]|nr:hypothetical protein [Kofleriaceae bacterium]
MARSLVAFALLVVVACKGKEPGGAIAETASAGGHVGIEDAATAFAKALASGDAGKIRAEMPPREAIAKYFACDTMAKRIEDTAARAIAQPAAVPKGGTFDHLEDTQTEIIDTDLDGCRVTEQLLAVRVGTAWKVGGETRLSSLWLVRLGKRWYGFDVPPAQ